MGRALVWGCLAAITLGGASCQSGNLDPGDPLANATTVAPVLFTPASSVSRIHAGEGAYPTLFSMQSSAIWVTPEVANEKLQLAMEAGDPVPDSLQADAATLVQQYLIIECHLESSFADSSIAYDAVSLRNVQLALETPSGRVPPIQVVMATPADDGLDGALKVFRRAVIVVFPLKNLWHNTPLIGSEASVVRLAMSGHNTNFYFEWPSSTSAPPEVDPLYKQWISRVDYNTLFMKVRRLAHVFD